MKKLLMTVMLLTTAASAVAGMECKSIYKYKEDNQFKSKEVMLKVIYDAHGFTKLQADETEAFYSVNKGESDDMTLSIAFPPDYTLGTISSMKYSSERNATISMVNGPTLYKIVCNKK